MIGTNQDSDSSISWTGKEQPRNKRFRKGSKVRQRRERFDDEVGRQSDVAVETIDPPVSLSSFRVTSHEQGQRLLEQAARENVWGIASAIDIYDCDPETIRDAEAIRRFVVELCDLIEMKRFGETQVVHFGEDERVAGYSMVQLIETSLISAHFANQTNAVYLDVFSCKPYNPEVVREFAQRFFQGADSSLQVSMRR